MAEKPTDEKELDAMLDEQESNESDDNEADDTTSSVEEEVESPEEDTSDGEVDEDKVEESKTVALKRERQMRKEYQEKVKSLEAKLEDLAKKDTPQGKAQSVRQEFNEMKGKLAIQELLLDDPTFKSRASEVKKIIFEEMPELLTKKDGIRIADDIAKGRLITTSEDTKKESPTNQTTPAQPKRKDVKKAISQQDYNKMSEDEKRAYENDLMQSLANK